MAAGASDLHAHLALQGVFRVERGGQERRGISDESIVRGSRREAGLTVSWQGDRQGGRVIAKGDGLAF